MKEIELKILDIDIDAMRNKLDSIGAMIVKEENQVNNIFDFEDRRLLDKKGYARIRTVEDLLNNTHRCYMTTKKMLSQDTYKVMEENEVEISDAEGGKMIFKALGLNLVESISKYRESYKYKSTLIEIDVNDKNFCPFPYIELESEDEEEIKEVVALLGYEMKDTTSKTVYEILNGKGTIEGV